MSMSFRTITPAMDVKAGLIAGFIATVVLSILMVAKSSMGLMPQLNPIEDIVQVAHLLTGMTLPLPFGWIGHFLLGTVVWGIIYAALQASLPGAPIVKGLIFGALAWLAMMIIFTPLAGHGVVRAVARTSGDGSDARSSPCLWCGSGCGLCKGGPAIAGLDAPASGISWTWLNSV